jgi:hypothetical protein
MSTVEETTTASSFMRMFRAPLRTPLALSLIGLLLGVSVEILFHGHPLGVSFPIWTLLCILGLFAASYVEGVRPSLAGWLLPIPILFLAVMAALRMEPLTSFLNVVLVLALLALWVRSFGGRNPMHYGWLDFGVALAWAPLVSWILPWRTLKQVWDRFRSDKRVSHRLVAVLRGLLLAIPILLVFIGLLHSADLIFAASIDRALSWLNLQLLAEWVGRLMVVFISGFFLLGAITAAVKDSRDWKPVGEGKPFLSPFLGITETTIVTTAVNLLFAFFVIIQLRYLFGGEANITAAGYTYAEYARRGFSELVAVAFLTLALILALANWTRIEGKRQRRTFAGLSGMMVGLVGVILASALVRLLLYENAYGFTRLRTYTHVAIYWMGALFVAFLVMLLLGQLRRIPHALVIGSIGFAITLNLLNVDAFVVKQNTNRLEQSGKIDLEYVLSLSEDATPMLLSLSEQAPLDVQQELLPQLACLRSQQAMVTEHLSWPSYHFSRSAEERLLSRYEAIDAYRVWQSVSDEWLVNLDGEDIACVRQPWLGEWGR